MGDRACVIISVLNTSSGTSSGGGKHRAGLGITTASPNTRYRKRYLVIAKFQVTIPAICQLTQVLFFLSLSKVGTLSALKHLLDFLAECDIKTDCLMSQQVRMN